MRREGGEGQVRRAGNFDRRNRFAQTTGFKPKFGALAFSLSALCLRVSRILIEPMNLLRDPRAERKKEREK